MAHSNLTLRKVPSAPRGSKKGWAYWTGQVPLDLNDRLEALLGARHRGDLVEEALRQYVERHERKAA